MAIARRVGGFSPAQADDLRKAISKKNHKLMATLKEPLMEGLGREERAAGGGQQDVGELRGHRRLLVQQESRRLLRDDQLPHRVAQGQLPRRVHGGPGLERHEHQGQGAVLRQPVPRDGHRGAAAGRQHQRRRVHRGGGQDPLRHERREGRRRRRHRGDHRGAGRGRAALRRSSTSAPASTRRWPTSACSRRSSAAARSTAPATRAAACSRCCPLAMSDGERRRKDTAQGQGDLFGGIDADRGRRPPAAHGAPDRVGPDDAAQALEKEALGLYVSAHPLQGLREQLHDEIEVPVARLDDAGDGAMTWTGGIVANAQKSVSKNGGVWLSFRLEDIDGGIECRAWPKVYEQYRELLVEDAIIKVKGRIERRAEGDITLGVIEVVPFNGVSEYHPLTVVIDSVCVAPTVMDDLRRVLTDFPGTVPVVLQMVQRRPARQAARRRQAARGPGRRAVRGAQGAARGELYRGRLRPAGAGRRTHDDPGGHARRSSARDGPAAGGRRPAARPLRRLRLRRGAHPLARVRRDAGVGRRRHARPPATACTTSGGTSSWCAPT